MHGERRLRLSSAEVKVICALNNLSIFLDPLLGHVGQNQPRPAKDMGLVKDGDIIGQGLEAYHGHRVASVVAQGKIYKWIKSDFVATGPQFVCITRAGVLRLTHHFKTSYIYVV